MADFPHTLGAAHSEALRILRGLEHVACPEEAASIVLEIVLNSARKDAVIDAYRELTEPQRKRLQEVLRNAAEGMPLAYALGECFFAGRRFFVNQGVLIPRPDTETLLEAARLWCEAQESALRVAEIGVGSGAVIISLAADFPDSGHRFYGTDTSVTAIETARRNAKQHAAPVDLRSGSLLEPLPANERFDLILSNPPYITEGDEVEDAVLRWEPREALMVPPGEPGTYYHERIARDASARLRAGGALMLEVGAGQAQAVGALLTDAGYSKVEAMRDFGGIERVVTGEWRG